MDVEAMLVAIRGAFTADATDDARRAGAAACHALLAALQPNAPAQPNAAVQLNAAAVAQAVSALRGVPAEQLLDLAIAKLRTALPAGVEPPAVKPLNFHFVPISRG
jgi:hypothetical protein